MCLDLFNYELCGCLCGVSYFWYLYSVNWLKYLLIRGMLLCLWCEVCKSKVLVDVWVSIVEDKEKVCLYKICRGMGGFVCLQWEEVNEIIVVFNLYMVKQYGLDCVVGFLLILVMLMVFYVVGV